MLWFYLCTANKYFLQWEICSVKMNSGHRYGSSFHGTLLPLSWSSGDGHGCLFSHDCSTIPGYFAKLFICHKCLLSPWRCYFDMKYWLSQETVLTSTLSGCPSCRISHPPTPQHRVCWKAISILRSLAHTGSFYNTVAFADHILYHFSYWGCSHIRHSST